MYLFSNIPILYINLDRAQSRNQKLLDLFKCFSVKNYTRIEAIDGNDLDIGHYKSKYVFGKPALTKYEIGCTLSHLKAIKYGYELNVPYIIIIEDDVSFDYLCFKNMELFDLIKSLDKTDSDWDVIQLGLISTNKNFDILKNGGSYDFVKGYDSGAFGYLINRKGMGKILDIFELGTSIHVSEIYIFGNLNTYMIQPYFTYYFRDQEPSFIRENTKSSMATQTKSKKWWDEFYGIK